MAVTVTPSSLVQAQAMQREGFLAQWAPIIITNKLPEETVSMDYINKLLERDYGGNIVI